MTKILVAIAISIFATNEANAFCSRGLTIGGSAIEEEFKYLICLHNEQVELLNEHSESIRLLSEQILRMEDNAVASADRIVSLESQLQDLRLRIERIESVR